MNNFLILKSVVGLHIETAMI